jgi:hypothetical protein
MSHPVPDAGLDDYARLPWTEAPVVVREPRVDA